MAIASFGRPFYERLEEVEKKDPEWIKYTEKRDHHCDEWNKLKAEVEELKRQKREIKDDKQKKGQLSLKTLERDLAQAKWMKADNQQKQRSRELRKHLLLQDLKRSINITWEKRWLQERMEEVEREIQYYKGEVSRWESKAAGHEERLGLLEKEVSESSKRLLDEAMKAGFVEVVIIVCVVLGQPGVGKTCIKYLLLDQRPPHLRSSTICSETPLRIEIKRMSEARIQTLKGNWKEVKGEEMLEIVARMILLAEQDTNSSLDSLEEIPKEDAKVTPNEATVKVEKKKNVLVKIINWVTMQSKDASPSKKAASTRAGAEASSTGDGEGGASTGAVALPADACQSAMTRIMDKLVQCISKLKLKCERGELSHSLAEQLLRSLWVYFSDCGGQPQYHELLPLFVRSISSALCVTCLTDKLDEIQAVEYYNEGKRVGVPQQSQLSAKDTIQCLVNTIQSYSTQEKPPSIIMVGTHLDQLEEKMKKQLSLSQASPESPSSSSSSSGAATQSSDEPLPAGERIETLEEKNKQLLKMLEPEFSDQLVYFSHDMKQLLFPLNALGRGKREKAIAHTIRCAVERSGAREVKKVPIWWYVLELLLQELSKELSRGVLSRAECLQMARLLNIREESFDAALVYFDELNVIKYSPEVLPKVIFVNSQIQLDKVSELIYHSYLLRQPQPVVAAEAGKSSPDTPVMRGWKHFRDYGVVSEDILEQFPRHYVQGIFSKDDLSKLLMSLLIFAEIPPPDWLKDPNSFKQQKYYLMLSLLPTLSEAELEKYRASSPVAATLLIRFPGGSRRAGVFCCLVTHLIRHCAWDLLLKSNQCLYRNCISLQLLTSPPCTITLIDSNTYIEVHVSATAPVPRSEYAGHFPTIRQAIVNGIRAACSRLSYKTTKPELTFLCPHNSPSPSPPTSSANQPAQELKQHTATLTKDKKYWSCDIQQLSGLLNDWYSIWFGRSQVPQGDALRQDNPASITGDSPTLGSTPSLAKLSLLRTAQGKKIKIIERIGPFWQRLGDQLDFDNNGSKLALIKADHSTSEACCRAMFQHWLSGNGLTPCSWRTLIDLLDDLDEVVLAQDIQSALSAS